VDLNGKTSSWREVILGLGESPRGSILGRVLFLIFINNLDLQTALLTRVKKFAHDIKLDRSNKMTVIPAPAKQPGEAI
jgi:hypothetical protein